MCVTVVQVIYSNHNFFFQQSVKQKKTFKKKNGCILPINEII